MVLNDGRGRRGMARTGPARAETEMKKSGSQGRRGSMGSED